MCAETRACAIAVFILFDYTENKSPTSWQDSSCLNLSYYFETHDAEVQGARGHV